MLEKYFEYKQYFEYFIRYTFQYSQRIYLILLLVLPMSYNLVQGQSVNPSSMSPNLHISSFFDPSNLKGSRKKHYDVPFPKTNIQMYLTYQLFPLLTLNKEKGETCATKDTISFVKNAISLSILGSAYYSSSCIYLLNIPVPFFYRLVIITIRSN